jgi:putative membrane protein
MAQHHQIDRGKMKEYLLLVLKGMAYGVTNLVPAIGGGTILILLGIYERFVDAWGNLWNWKRWKKIIPFLAVLLVGAAIGMIALSKLINYLLNQYEIPTMLFFIGLLLGTIPSVFKMHGDMRLTVGRAESLVVGVAVVVLLRIVREQTLAASAREIQNASGFLYYVVTSFLAGAASVTPGMDGSSVFMLAGTYEPITAALSALSHLDVHWMTIIATGLGAGPGIILFSKLIDTAIKRAAAVVYYCVLGIIAGSAYGLWPRGMTSASTTTLLVAGAVFVVGLALALVFNRPAKAEEASPQL